MTYSLFGVIHTTRTKDLNNIMKRSILNKKYDETFYAFLPNFKIRYLFFWISFFFNFIFFEFLAYCRHLWLIQSGCSFSIFVLLYTWFGSLFEYFACPMCLCFTHKKNFWGFESWNSRFMAAWSSLLPFSLGILCLINWIWLLWLSGYHIPGTSTREASDLHPCQYLQSVQVNLTNLCSLFSHSLHFIFIFLLEKRCIKLN